MDFLYHGTLLDNDEAIQNEGLVPRIGEFTLNSYGNDAKNLIPAVFMADESGLERVVHAMVAAIMDQIEEADFNEWEVSPDAHMNDSMFCKYGVIYLIEPSKSFMHSNDKNKASVPVQAEDGDWYSLETVKPVSSLTGEFLRSFLEEKGILPSSINDFGDKDYKNTFSL